MTKIKLVEYVHNKFVDINLSYFAWQIDGVGFREGREFRRDEKKRRGQRGREEGGSYVVMARYLV